MKHFVWTIGCQMNQADSRRLASALESAGSTPAEHIDDADLIILNTCVVRQSAEDKVYGRLSSLKPLKDRHPELIVGLMGCLVGVGDATPLRERFPWVDVLMPPSDPTPLLQHLSARGLVDERDLEPGRRVASGTGCAQGDRPSFSHSGACPVSDYVPIVLGCSHACSYCIIPYRRGAERSRPVDDIVRETRALVNQGVQEITLLGQIVDRYGYDLKEQPEYVAGNTPLVSLLRRVHEIDGLTRIRFLTSHPAWM